MKTDDVGRKAVMSFTNVPKWRRPFRMYRAQRKLGLGVIKSLQWTFFWWKNMP